MPAPFGLSSVWTLVPVADRHELAGVRWQPLSCAGAYTTPWCDDDVDTGYPKNFESPEVLYAPPVTVYAGSLCNVIGETFDEARTRARTSLNLGEARALEEYVWTELLAPLAVDITPGTGAPGLLQGIGAAEEAFAQLYGGVGVVHLPVGLGTPAGGEGALIRDGARLRTWPGNYVALGAGYPNTGPDGSAPIDGEAWVFVSGPVVVRREDVDDVPDTDSEAIDMTVNDRYVLAERTSVIGVECAVTAIRVEVSC